MWSMAEGLRAHLQLAVDEGGEGVVEKHDVAVAEKHIVARLQQKICITRATARGDRAQRRHLQHSHKKQGLLAHNGLELVAAEGAAGNKLRVQKLSSNCTL